MAETVLGGTKTRRAFAAANEAERRRAAGRRFCPEAVPEKSGRYSGGAVLGMRHSTRSAGTPMPPRETYPRCQQYRLPQTIRQSQSTGLHPLADNVQRARTWTSALALRRCQPRADNERGGSDRASCSFLERLVFAKVDDGQAERVDGKHVARNLIAEAVDDIRRPLLPAHLLMVRN